MVLLSVLLSGTASAGDDPYTDQQLLTVSEEYRTVHPGELTILKQVAPKFPKKAHKQGYRHEECTVQVYVGEKGKAEAATVLGGCPEVFHRSVEKAAKKWRFEPVIGADGMPEAVTFVLRFRFEQD